MNQRYTSILETIGNTPVVRINNLAPLGVSLFVKIEAFSPMGSVKDRLALGVIEDAERRGDLAPGQTVVEATSGNTGIGLAMVCAQKGYPLVVTMAENFSVERRKLMHFLGARVVLTPTSEKGSGMVAKARELAEKHGWWQSRQFENPANAAIHERTTAVEILRDFADQPLDYWVTGFGTGGTLSGVSRVLKRESPHTRIVVCEPDNAAILASGIPQDRLPDGGHAQSHAQFRPHLMQGWTPDFIPQLVEPVLAEHRIDEYLAINGKAALRCARELASREGIFVGISAGATFAGALQVAERAPAGTTLLCMLPDTGERYLSTPLFEDVPVEMTEEETLLSCSTPGYRFDVAPRPTPSGVAAPAEATDAEAEAEVDRLIGDPHQPVVMFALEWCEFGWSVRKLLRHYAIPYESVDLDAVDYQQDNLGGRIRAVLRARTGVLTLPQIFIGGDFVGGCTELFEESKDERLFTRLLALHVTHDTSQPIDPYGLLPGWLHPR